VDIPRTGIRRRTVLAGGAAATVAGPLVAAGPAGASGSRTYDLTVLTRGSGEAGTTLSGNVLGEVGQQSPFAGHASECFVASPARMEALRGRWGEPGAGWSVENRT